MNFSSTISLIVVTVACMMSLSEAGKSKKYKLSGKRVEAGKYARRCEKDDVDVLVLDESSEVKEIAELLLKNNVGSAWIGGIDGTDYDGAFLLNVEAKRKGKYGSHSFTLVPANKMKQFSGEHFALCRRSDE